MELEDAIHTALLTLKEGYEGRFKFDILSKNYYLMMKYIFYLIF